MFLTWLICMKFKPGIQLTWNKFLPMETHLKDYKLNDEYYAEVLKRQFDNTRSRKAVESSPKNFLLTPFLLSLPVIAIVLIISFTIHRQSTPVLQKATEVESLTASPVPPAAREHPEKKTVFLAGKEKELHPRTDSKSDNSPAPFVKSPGAITSAVGTKKSRSVDDIVHVQPAYKVQDKSIRNLSLDVANRSAGKLDLVVVEVTYLNQNDHPTKRETLYIKDIPASQKTQLSLPDGQLSGKVRYKVSLVTARDAGVYVVPK